MRDGLKKPKRREENRKRGRKKVRDEAWNVVRGESPNWSLAHVTFIVLAIGGLVRALTGSLDAAAYIGAVAAASGPRGRGATAFGITLRPRGREGAAE
jgi:hypothetical protein